MTAAVSPQARNFMNRQVRTVTPDVPLADVVTLLIEQGISNVPVVQREGERSLLVGFISERDCLEHLSNEAFYGSPMPPQTAGTVMRKHPVCVDPGTELFTLVSIFVHHGYRHLPVVDADNQLLGLVSRRDILRALDEFYRQSLREHDQQHFPPDVHELIHHRFLMKGR
ncbi:MAG TPA: CBS domain-containing protein [Planctomycetaceae bacterium]|nr:CBS domain-containing protein [Planctomycetaceae bacterium]